MIFQTFEHGYEVIHLYKTLPSGEIYICRDTETGNTYSLLCVSDEALIPRLVSYFSMRMGGGVFTDFSEYFFHDRRLCVTLKHPIGTTLDTRLSEGTLSLSERLLIGQKILERIVLQEPPAYFLKKGLRPSEIAVDNGLELCFRYLADDPEEIENCTARDITEALSSLFRLLFEKELEKKNPAPLMSFLNALSQNESLDFLALYTSFTSMAKEVSALPEEALAIPDTWPFRLWEKIKKLGLKLKKLLMWLLIIAAVIYLIFTIGDSLSEGEGSAPFHSIGDIEFQP